MDSNGGALVLEATALPTEPQPLPKIPLLFFVNFEVDDSKTIELQKTHSSFPTKKSNHIFHPFSSSSLQCLKVRIIFGRKLVFK